MGPREFHEEIGSTQDRCIELVRQGATEGTRVVARRQAGGRGRLDHAWSSPSGGLYLSIALRTSSEHVSWLPLLLGARLAEGLSDRFALPLRVKWPNDLLLISPTGPARKVGGVLVDRVEGPGRLPVEVAGFGLNVATALETLPPQVRERAASLTEFLRPPPSLDEVESIVVERSTLASAELRGSKEIGEIRAQCLRWLFGIGRRATVDGTTTGTIAGLGDSGELLLDQGPHRLVIRAGDVRVEGVA